MQNKTYSLAAARALLTAPGAPFEMEQMDIRGSPVRVWKNALPTLRALLQHSRQYGERPYWIYQDERLSYAEHYRRAAQLATVLRDHYGIGRGERVAIAMRNYPEWVMSFWAVTSIGAIAVPLNACWSGAELHYGLADSGAVLLVTDSERAERIIPYRDQLDLRSLIVVRNADPLPHGMEAFADVLNRAGAVSELPDVSLEPEDNATLFYTSGTLGKPKGALGTHRNITTNPYSLAYIAALVELYSGRIPAILSGNNTHLTSLVTVPLFHVTGCHSMLMSATLAGNTLVAMYKWNPETALELIERERINIFGGVPGMVWQLLESAAFAERDTSSLRQINYGGAPAAPQLIRRIRELFPHISPRNGYGMTETSSLFSASGGELYIDKPDSVGPLVAICDARIVDDAGCDLPAGCVGELWARGPNVVQGYWNRPQETALTFAGGWLRTGDLARLDTDGCLYIVDRARDMLIRGGENVYCVEVEDALYSHAAVMDAAVVGLEDRILGEQVAAVVQIKAGAATSADELRQHVAQRLAAFKVPVHIELRDQPLPRNANGKIMKRQLREELNRTRL
jgi:long-chain acyl-CoA synthetase